MGDVIMSTIAGVPVSYPILSAFSYYAHRWEGELPGSWLVAALSELGIKESATRQTLYRMESKGELASRRSGRMKCYRLTSFTRASLAAGHAKIFEPQDPEWGGHWTIVHFRFRAEQRMERERLTDIARSAGYAMLAPGLWVHPRDRAHLLVAPLQERDLEQHLTVFRGELRAGVKEEELAQELYELEALNRRYRRFIKSFRPLLRRTPKHDPPRAFAVRFATVFAYLQTAWRDPELPARLLPADWAGERARVLAAKLYNGNLAAAVAFGDDLMDRIVGTRMTAAATAQKPQPQEGPGE